MVIKMLDQNTDLLTQLEKQKDINAVLEQKISAL